MRKIMVVQKDNAWKIKRIAPEMKEPLSNAHRIFINQFCFFDEIKYKVIGKGECDCVSLLSALENIFGYAKSDSLHSVIEGIIEDMLYDGSCAYLIEYNSNELKLEFEIPKNLGGKRLFRKNKYFLKDFLQEKMNSYISDLQQDKTTAYLKLRESYNEHCLAMERAFCDWGFVSSDSLPVSSFYVAYQRLKIERTKALLRDYIVERINKLLSSMNIDARISLVEDVLSPLDIEQKIEALNSGDLMIKDAAGIRC